MKYEGRRECVDTVPFEEMSRGRLLSKEASRQNFGRLEETTLILHFKLLPATVKKVPDPGFHDDRLMRREYRGYSFVV
jgi:hypothetical protein